MSAVLNESNKPSYTNASTLRQAPALQIVRDLDGGTAKMRAARTIYLPIEAGESPDAYDVRLARSLLFNTFVKVREGLLGIGLKRRKPKPAPLNPDGTSSEDEKNDTVDSDIELQPDVPPIIRQHCEDIDLAGNHLDVFARELFRDVINDGHAIVLVDMQPPLERSLTSLSATPTALDDRMANRRPYWVKYKKDQARNWKHDHINGEEVLTQVSLKECATEPDGEYGEKEVTRYRVLRLPVLVPKTPRTAAVYGPMTWTLYEKQTVNGQEIDVAVGGGQTDLPCIPIVPIYARKKALLESDPPLLDLAYLNIGHWQQWSDLNCQLRMLVPILVIMGELKATESDDQGARKPKVGTGPGAVLQGDKDGEIKYVSHDGAAIDSTRQALIDLEQRMSAVGLSIISQKQDTEVTATEKVMDQGERESELGSWVRGLKDGIEACLKIHAAYLNLPDGGSIKLGFGEVTAEAQQAVTAINAPKGIPGNVMPPNSSTMVQ